MGLINKLILHFDVNKTLIIEDKVSGKTADYIILCELAEKTKACWEPSITSPISYADYVVNYLCPGNKSDISIKSQRKKYIATFLDFLKDHPEAHINANYTQVKEAFDLSMEKIPQSDRCYILPSFYHLIKHLNEKKIDYIICLRTFGKDLRDVMHEIQMQNKQIQFSSLGSFNEHELTLRKTGSENAIRIKDKQAIYDTIHSHDAHLALQDHWKYWNNHGEKAEFGKLFPFESSGETVSIFFDDNIEIDKESLLREQNIIAPYDLKMNKVVSISNVLDEGYAYKVDTLGAINDKHYFEKLVDRTLRIQTIKRMEKTGIGTSQSSIFAFNMRANKVSVVREQQSVSELKQDSPA